MWAAAANAPNAASANFAWNPGVPKETIDAMRALGDQIARRPTVGFGSTGSAGVDLTTFGLLGLSDRRQFADPSAVVIPQS
jgi:hypothetical protein